ncbi:MAG TPA: PDZ domain-containing protein [bacterium]|nr:PDZ domain-containing protein [bacterium]
MHALTASLLSLFLIAPLSPGWLGIYLADDTDVAKVAEVIPGTPAQKAGLQQGDLLLAVDDTETKTREAFIAAIRSHAAGDRVKLRLERKGKRQVVVVRLGERPENPGAGAPVVAIPEPSRPPQAPEALRMGGRRGGRGAPAAEVAPVAPRSRGYLGLSVREGDGGLVVDRVLDDGPCADCGLAQGDVIRAIGDHRIRSLDDLDQALAKLAPGRKIQIVASNGPRRKVVNVELGSRPRHRSGHRAPMVVETPVLPDPVPAPVAVEVAEEPEPAVERDLQRELRDLRREIRELRKMLEELRKQKGRE